MWNYWHFAWLERWFTTARICFRSVAAAIAAIVVLKLADWSAPLVAKYFGLEGISLPTLSSVVFFPIGLLFDKIIDKIHGVSRIHDPEKTFQKNGIFGEPMMVGGTILGMACWASLPGMTLNISCCWGSALAVSCSFYAYGAILMEGLLPLSRSH